MASCRAAGSIDIFSVDLQPFTEIKHKKLNLSLVERYLHIWPSYVETKVDECLILDVVLRSHDLFETMLSTLHHQDGFVLLTNQVVVDSLSEIRCLFSEKKIRLETELLKCDAVLPLVIGCIRVT